MARAGGSKRTPWSPPTAARLARLPGHIAYWFAWQSFVEGAPLAEADAR